MQNELSALTVIFTASAGNDLYHPFQAFFIAVFVACAVFCVAFMIWKFALEKSQYAEKAERLQKPGELAAALSQHESRE